MNLPFCCNTFLFCFLFSQSPNIKQTNSCLPKKINQVLESRFFNKSVKGKAEQSKIKVYANKAEILGLLANATRGLLPGGDYKS